MGERAGRGLGTGTGEYAGAAQSGYPLGYPGRFGQAGGGQRGVEALPHLRPLCLRVLPGGGAVGDRAPVEDLQNRDESLPGGGAAQRRVELGQLDPATGTWFQRSTEQPGQAVSGDLVKVERERPSDL